MARTVVAVVVAVAAAIDVALYHGVARHHEVGRAVVLRAHVAADVVAGHDVAVVAAGHVDATRVLDVGVAAAAVDVVDDNLGLFRGRDDGANLLGHGDAVAAGQDVAHGLEQRAYVEVFVVGAGSLDQGLVVGHVALVAAAVDRADAARVELYERHVVHGGKVVAAVEVVHVEDAVVGIVAVPQASVVGGVAFAVDGVVGVDEVAVHEGLGEVRFALCDAVDVVDGAVAKAFDSA